VWQLTLIIGYWHGVWSLKCLIVKLLHDILSIMPVSFVDTIEPTTTREFFILNWTMNRQYMSWYYCLLHMHRGAIHSLCALTITHSLQLPAAQYDLALTLLVSDQLKQKLQGREIEYHRKWSAGLWMCTKLIKGNNLPSYRTASLLARNCALVVRCCWTSSGTCDGAVVDIAYDS